MKRRRWCSYHPRRRTCRWWSSLWRRSEIWARCRCSCQTPASPREAPVSSPRPSAGQTHHNQLSESYRNTCVLSCVSVRPLTCAKYSSEIRPAHSMQSSSGLQGFATSAHLINILFISSRFSGEFLMLAWPSQSLFTLCRNDNTHTWASAHTQ